MAPPKLTGLVAEGPEWEPLSPPQPLPAQWVEETPRNSTLTPGLVLRSLPAVSPAFHDQIPWQSATQPGSPVGWGSHGWAPQQLRTHCWDLCCLLGQSSGSPAQSQLSSCLSHPTSHSLISVLTAVFPERGLPRPRAQTPREGLPGNRLNRPGP